MQKKSSLWRLVALIACVCLLGSMTLLSGCGEEEKPDDAGATTTTTAGEGDDTVSSVKTALKFTPNEEMDLGGKEITVSCWGDPAPEGVDQYFDRRYTLARRTEERYNVKIKFIAAPTATFSQDVALAFSSGKKYADLMFAPSYYAFDVARLGAALPLDDYIDYNSPHYALTGDNLLYVDGKHYSYMPDELSTNNIGYFVTYNETLLEQYNCEDPWTLYQEGKWDWDAFAKIAQQTTVITDGEVTQWGVGGSNLLQALCLSNGFSMITMDTKANKFTCGLYSDAGTNTLNFFKKLTYDFKACDGNFGGHNSKITFGDTKVAMLICPSYYPGTFVSSGMAVRSVPMPKGPDVDGYINGLEMQEWWLVSAISELKPEELIQVALDMNDNDPAYEDTYFSAEGKKDNFVIRAYDGNVFTTEEEAEFFYDYVTDDKIEWIMDISTADIKAVITENVCHPISGGEEPRTVLERVKPVVDEGLKKMLPDKLQ